MQLVLTGHTSLALTLDDRPLAISVDSDDDEVDFSPLHMLAGSLATCTAAVLAAYAETAHLNIDQTSIDLAWDYVEDPYRVGTYQMNLHFPEHIEANRRKALLRAAEQCTVHATLQHSPKIEIS